MLSPHYGYAIDKVESVQRRFAKRLPGFHDMEYSARLDKLNLQSLEYRRLVADLILTYTRLSSAWLILIDIWVNVYFRLKGPENAHMRGNPYKIVINQCRPVVKVRGRGLSPPAPIWAPCNSMSPLIESEPTLLNTVGVVCLHELCIKSIINTIKCYFMPK